MPTRDRGPAPFSLGARARPPLVAVLTVVVATLTAVFLLGPPVETGGTAEVGSASLSAPTAPEVRPGAPGEDSGSALSAGRASLDEAAGNGTASARIGDLAPSERVAPVGLRIPTIGLDGPVVPTGARGGAFDVLDGVEEIGWYQHGPSPGESGSAVLAAHVDTAADGPGLFFELDRLRVGDGVEVALEDGATTAFEVVAIERYRKEELPVDRLFARTGEPQLALITCGGAFDPVLRRYEDNVVVYAAPTR